MTNANETDIWLGSEERKPDSDSEPESTPLGVACRVALYGSLTGLTASVSQSDAQQTYLPLSLFSPPCSVTAPAHLGGLFADFKVTWREFVNFCCEAAALALLMDGQRDLCPPLSLSFSLSVAPQLQLLQRQPQPISSSAINKQQQKPNVDRYRQVWWCVYACVTHVDS